VHNREGANALARFGSGNWVIFTIVSSPSAQNGCHHQPKRGTKLSSHRKGVRLER
jgi:hypothetical protein